MDNEVVKQDFLKRFPFKENPHNFPIVKKYNAKVYRKNQIAIFDYICDLVEKELGEETCLFRISTPQAICSGMST